MGASPTQHTKTPEASSRRQVTTNIPKSNPIPLLTSPPSTSAAYPKPEKLRWDRPIYADGEVDDEEEEEEEEEGGGDEDEDDYGDNEGAERQEERSDELRGRIYGISTPSFGNSVVTERRGAKRRSAANIMGHDANLMNNSLFATRFARFRRLREFRT